MWRQIKTKKYWLRVGAYFLWWLIVYTAISYAFREDRDLFWKIEKIQSRSIFSFFMAIIFAYQHRQQSSDIAGDIEPVRTPWTIKGFFILFALMLLLSIFCTSILFGIGWIIMHLVYEEVEPIGNAFVKMLLITAVMSLFATIIFFLSDRFGSRWQRRRF